MDFTSQLAKRYRFLFSLPSQPTLVIQSILLGIFFAVASYWFAAGSDGLIFGFFDGAISLALSSVLCGYLIGRSGEGNGDFLITRRALGMMIFGIFFVGVGILAGGVFARIFEDGSILEKIYFLSCGLIVVYEYVVISSVSKTKGINTPLYSVAQPVSIVLVHSMMHYIFNGEIVLSGFFTFCLICFVSIITAKAYYASIERAGKKNFGLGSISLFRSFIASFMLGESELLESDLQKISIKKDIEVRLLCFRNKTQRCLLVAPLVHPGPFKNVGGAALPTVLAETLDKSGIVPIIFHTPTTHEDNPILREDCRRIVNTIIGTKFSEGSGLASKATCSKVGRITVTVQIFGRTPLVVITRSPVPTEDLPQRVHDACIKKIVEFGFPDGIVVDAHNSMETTYEVLEKQDEDNVLSALEQSLAMAASETGELFAGFSRLKFEGFSRKDGAGDGGVMALVTQVKNQKAAYISLDGNNLLSGLREKIRKALFELGYENSEVATTDTHIVTGTAGGQGYNVLGKVVPEEAIIEKAIQAVKEAESKISSCTVEFSKPIVEKVSLLGHNGLEILESITEESIHAAKRGVIWLLGIPIMCAAILFLLT